VTVLAIDPGCEKSAWVLYDGERPFDHQIEENNALLSRLRLNDLPFDAVVTEQVTSYGMAVGAEVFETVFWTGRFHEAAQVHWRKAARVPRRDVKLHLCQSARAKDANVRQALLDRFGGKDKACGKKTAPGPLYGLKADEWQALALAVTYYDLHGATIK